ncbi:MAG TPA: ABC transporter substrate-binding protein, partial [Candidatus Dormibacteraeota bacterium]|nr:ABC transporter substrate-binding protein [Candidatus Dormibacteraeota bacterium]
MLVLLVAVLLAGLGVGRAPAVRSTVYREAIVAPPGPSVLSTLVLPQDPVAQAVAALTAPGLLVGGWRGQPTPGLAATWRAEDGGRRYAFTLRPGARWSTGRPVAMRDVAFTLRVLQSPGFTAQSATGAWAGVRLVVTGPRAGTFVLPEPSAAFPVAAEVPVLPSAPFGGRAGRYLRAAAVPTGPPPPAAGPFVVLHDGVGAVWLRRNPWARPRPLLASVVLVREAGPAAAGAALRQGRVDGWLAATPAELRHLPAGLLAHRLTSFAFVAVLFNERAQPLADVRLRRALAAAVDRPALVQQALGGLGVPQTGPIPVSIGWAQPRPGTLPATVPAAAQLTADGWRAVPPGAVRTRAGRPLRLRLTVPDLPPLPAVAAALRRQFRAVGVALTVR